MGKKEPRARKPLLYIEQPKLQLPKQNMQTIYSTSASMQTKSKLESQIAETKPEPKRRRSRNKDVGDAFYEEGVSFEEKEESSMTPADYFRETANRRRPFAGLRLVKSFPSMSNHEKIDYLSSTQPYYSCVFITKERRVIGTIHQYDGKQVTIKTNEGKFEVIEEEEVEAIRIMT